VLSVALLVLVLSVMNGFDRELRENIIGLEPHASINGNAPIRNWQALAREAVKHPQVEAAAPFIHYQAMAVWHGQSEAIQVQGVDRQLESKVSVIERFIKQGSFAALDTEPNGIVMGASLADALHLNVGDTFSLIVPLRDLEQAPAVQRVKLVAIFDSGTQQDRKIAIGNLSMAADMLGYGDAVQGVRLRVRDLFQASSVAFEILNQLPDGYYVRDWTLTQGNLYESVNTSRRLILMLIGIVVAVAAFNLVSTLVMVVTEKREDIAILKTLGLSPRGIMSVFMVQGMAIGLVGNCLGAIIGVSLTLVVGRLIQAIEYVSGVRFLQLDVYPVNHLPVDVHAIDVLLVVVVAQITCMLATIYPSWSASRIAPAEALRFEV